MRRSRVQTTRRSRPSTRKRTAGRGLVTQRKRARMSYVSKSKYGSRTVTRNKRRSNYMSSNNEELNQSSRSLGKRMRFTNRFTRRFVQKNTENQTHSLVRVSGYGGLSGPLAFPNFQTGSGATKLAPCTIFDISSVTNARDGTLFQPQTTWNINFTNETGSALVQYVPAAAGW